MHVRWSCTDLPPEAPSPPSLHVSWAGVSHTAFDLAQHSDGASLSTFHSLHPPTKPSPWSKDCAMLDYNQLPLSTLNLGFMANG